MPRAADYDIISDDKISLKIGGDIDHEFPIRMAGANVGCYREEAMTRAQ